MKSSPSLFVYDKMFSVGCQTMARIVALISSKVLRSFCVFVSHSFKSKSCEVVTRSAPLGDQAAAVISAVCPVLKMRCRAQSLVDMTCTSRIAVGVANARPSGCHSTFAQDSDSVSTLLIIPSTFLIISGWSPTRLYM